MITFLRLELLRTASDKRFLILMVGMPVAMYLLFTNMFGASRQPVSGMDPDVGSMVSMAAFGAIGAALTVTAPRIAQERTNGWMCQLRVLPLPGYQVITAKVFAAMAWAVPAILAVSLAAVINHGVSLAGWQWLGIGVLLWVGTAPFAALGVWIGYVTDDNSAFGVMYGIYLFLGAAGGLWMPVNLLPSVLRTIAGWVPSNRFAQLGWTVAAGHAPSLPGAAILAGWLVVFVGVAFLSYRRATAVR